MSLLSQFFPSGGNGGVGGISLDMLIVGGGGGSGGTAGAGGTSTAGSFYFPNDCAPRNSSNDTFRCHVAISGHGGSGAVYEVFGYPVAPGGTYSITVGSGGAAGTGGLNGGTRGANGGASSFTDPTGDALLAQGGGGGGVAAVTAFPGNPDLNSPAYIADPTIAQGKPGGSGGGGALILRCFVDCAAPITCIYMCRHFFECGGTGCSQTASLSYQDIYNSLSCPIPLLGTTAPPYQTRWGCIAGSSAIDYPRYPLCPAPTAENAAPSQIVGGTGCITICKDEYFQASYMKNPTQRTVAPDLTNQAGYCTGCKYPCNGGAVVSSITGTPACYAVTKHMFMSGNNAPSELLCPYGNATPTAEPLIPAPRWTNCYECYVNASVPHPNDAGYGLGGNGVNALGGPVDPGPDVGLPDRCTCWFSGVGLTGSSGSVTVRYASSWGAVPAPNRPGSVDCSPDTPGYYTYRWTSPGSITLP